MNIKSTQKEKTKEKSGNYSVLLGCRRNVMKRRAVQRMELFWSLVRKNGPKGDNHFKKKKCLHVQMMAIKLSSIKS